MEIQHKEDKTKGSFFIEESGETPAQLTYSIASPNMIIIDHTEVSDKLAGDGIGKQLVNSIAVYAREHNIKIVALCPYAKAIMQKNKDYQDVLIKSS